MQSGNVDLDVTEEELDLSFLKGYQEGEFFSETEEFREALWQAAGRKNKYSNNERSQEFIKGFLSFYGFD